MLPFPHTHTPRIVAEDSNHIRLVRQVESGNQTTTTTTTVTLEFGDPPAVNISQPSAPSIAQEIEMAGEINDSVDIEVRPAAHVLSHYHPSNL